jgi:hypothetical protein
MQPPDRLRIGRRPEWAYYVAEFMTEYIDFASGQLPAIELDFERDGHERIEYLVNQLREFWNVGFGPITELAHCSNTTA